MTTVIIAGAAGGDTLVSSLDRIARQCSVKVPSSWITTSLLEHQEIRDDFLLETVEDILDRVDLPGPIGAQQVITGDGSETYTLNDDFMRLQRDDWAVYDQLLDRPCIPVSDDGTYTYLKDVGTAGVIRYYRIRGYKGSFTVDFHSAPTSDITITYMSVNWLLSSDSAAKSEFTDVGDVMLLPRRLVETGTVWRFRERRGLPYEDKYNEYEALMSRMGNDKRLRRTINFGEADRSVRWQDMVPAYIPDA